MGRKKASENQEPKEIRMGDAIRQSLMKLGYQEPPKISLQKIIAEIHKNTGKTVTKQRIYNILEADTLKPKTLEEFARSLGLTVAELMTGKKSTQ